MSQRVLGGQYVRPKVLHLMCHNYGTTTEHATALHGMNPMVCAGCHNKYGRSDMMSSKHWSDYVIHAIGPTVATRTSSIWHVWCALCPFPPRARTWQHALGMCCGRGRLNRLELICSNRYAVRTVSFLVHRNYQGSTEMS